MAVSVTFMRRLLLCVIGVMALSACGDPAGQSPAAGAPAAATASGAVVSVARPATPDSLSFSAARVGGGTIDLRPSTPVSRCCCGSGPPLERRVTTKPLRSKRQSQRWAGKVQFIGVAWYGDDSSFQGFRRQVRPDASRRSATTPATCSLDSRCHSNRRWQSSTPPASCRCRWVRSRNPCSMLPCTPRWATDDRHHVTHSKTRPV